MDGILIFAVFLYIACALLLVAEVFVPSGGILGLCALACVIGGVAIFFQHNQTLGWIGVVIALILIPTLLVISYKVFPKTRFGKAVTLAPPQRAVGDAIPDTEQLKDLLGLEGVTKTPLRPVGLCDFSGRRLECVAESGYVGIGATVEVIRVQGTQLTVREKSSAYLKGAGNA